jgi:hypothetical protein
MEWIDMAQKKDPRMALVNTVTNLRVPQNTGKFLNSRTTGGLSKMAQLRGVSEFPRFQDVIYCKMYTTQYSSLLT